MFSVFPTTPLGGRMTVLRRFAGLDMRRMSGKAPSQSMRIIRIGRPGQRPNGSHSIQPYRRQVIQPVLWHWSGIHADRSLDIEATPLQVSTAPHQYQAGQTMLQIMATFRATTSVTVRGKVRDFAGTKFGFINNIYSTNREFYYASQGRTKIRYFSNTKAKDGPGPGRWYEPPYSGAAIGNATGGQADEDVEITFEMKFEDFPLATCTIRDPQDQSNAISLDHVGGEDRFVMWLAIMDHAEDHIRLVESCAWHVGWAGTFNANSRTFTTTESAAGDGAAPGERPATASAALNLTEETSTW